MPSVNKSKLLEAAQKHISKGNLDKALKEYQKILKADAGDTGIRLKVGELCERIGDRAQALAEYRRVASSFTSQGFYSKAVAVLKRIQNADPDQVEIHLELAELNEKLGLLSEVVHHYQLAANVYDRKGEKRAAIDVLKKVSEVGQSNLERKVKVAELYYKEGFPEAGYEQFTHAIADLEERSPELLDIAIRMCKASPDDPKLIERLGAVYLGQGEPKQAVEALEHARSIAEEPSTLELLAQAKLQIELPGEAKTLFEKAAALYEDRRESAAAREAAARATELAAQSLEGEGALVAEAPPPGPPPEAPAEDAGEAATPAPGIDAPREQATDPPEAVEPAGAGETGTAELPEGAAEAVEDEGESAFTAGGYEVDVDAAPAAEAEEEPETTGEEEELGEDERLELAFSEAEVYRKYGKLEGAARVLEAVAKRFPQRHEPRIRLKEIYEAAGNWAKVADQCRMLGLIASARGDELRSNRFLEQAREALARLEGGAGEESAEVSGPEPADAPAPASREMEPPAPQEAAPPPGPLEAEGSSALDIRIEGDDLPGGDGPGDAPSPAGGPSGDAEPATPADPLAAIEDQLIRPDAFGGSSDPETAGKEGGGSPEGQEAAADGLLDLELVIDDDGANPEGAPLSPGEDGSGPEAALEPAASGEAAAPQPISEDRTEAPASGAAFPAEDEDEDEDVDLKQAELLASRGMIEAAVSIYARGVELYPEDGNLRARHQSLLARLEPAAGEERSGDDAPALDETRDAPDAPGGEDVLEPEEDGSNAVVLLDEVEEEDPSWEWVSTHGRLSTSNELGETAAASPQAPAEDEAPGEASAFDLRAVLEQDPDAVDAIGNVSDATEALNDLVSELKKEEQEVAASLDVQTHYDLGVAYKEMGLLEEAVRELTMAAGDAGRRVECCEVLGICYRELGRPEEAVRMLEECLGDGSIAAESAPGLLYEMAVSQEAMGNLGKALDWYERVHRIDPHFNDVSARMAALREGSGEPEEPPANPLEGEGIDEIEEMLDDLETDD